jgi:hypothetical protein
MCSWLETRIQRVLSLIGMLIQGNIDILLTIFITMLILQKDKSESNYVMLSGREEYKVRVKGNVLIQLRGKKVMIKDVYYVPCLEKNLLLISSIMKHSLHLHIDFSDNVCFLLIRITKTMVVMGVEE